MTQLTTTIATVVSKGGGSCTSLSQVKVVAVGWGLSPSSNTLSAITAFVNTYSSGAGGGGGGGGGI